MKIWSVDVLGSRFHMPNFYSLRLGKPHGFSYKPAQAIAVHIGNDRRFYSLASHPSEPWLELGIKIKAGGKFSPRLFRMDRLEISGPYGFIMERVGNARRIAMLGFGSAISPFISLLKEFSLEQQKRQVLMIYGERSEIPFRDFLSSLGGWFRLVSALSSEGVHVQDLFHLVDEFRPELVLGIGSASFADEVRKSFPSFRTVAEGFG